MTRRETFDKKQQKLERMEKIARDAVRLKDAIKSEVDAILEEIDAEINSPRNKKLVFWDGKQPHYWSENGKYFRKATKCDIGKNVIVCSWDDPSPLSNLENQALLEHITQFDDFTVRSRNGSRLCHFPIAWVECDYLDGTFDDVPHICVFANTILAKQADKPEQPDWLIDGESCLEPKPGTVSEEKWTPKVGDKVRVIKPWLITHGLDCVITEAVNGIYTADAGKVASLGLSAKDLELIETNHIGDANKKVPPNGYRLLDKSAKSEPRKAGDLFWSRTARKWMELVDDSVEYANRDDWPACRKIEEPAPQPDLLLDEESFLKPEPGTVSEEPRPEPWTPVIGDWVKIRKPADPSESPGWGDDELDGNTCWITEVAKDECGCDVKVHGSNFWLSSKWLTPCDPPYQVPEAEKTTWYREPTQADLVNGPIEVEVCDDGTQETNWEKRMLYAVLPTKFMFPYVVGSPGLDEFTQTWRFARIKVEG